MRQSVASSRGTAGPEKHAASATKSRSSTTQLSSRSPRCASRAGPKEVSELLNKSLDRLPLDHRQVVRVYDLEGRSAAEVAGTMGRSQGAVHMLRARAYDRLRELLGAESRFFSDRA